jgi:hypothetical protein
LYTRYYINHTLLFYEQIQCLGLELSLSELVRLLVCVCGHCDSKRACGAVLAELLRGRGLGAQEAVGLVYDVVSFDFFSELRGHMKDLRSELPDEVGSLLEGFLKERERLDEHGDILESDQDEKGNLQGFVVYSDESSRGASDSDERGASDTESEEASIGSSYDSGVSGDGVSAGGRDLSDVSEVRPSHSRHTNTVKRVTRVIYSDSEDDS